MMQGWGGKCRRHADAGMRSLLAYGTSEHVPRVHIVLYLVIMHYDGLGTQAADPHLLALFVGHPAISRPLVYRLVEKTSRFRHCFPSSPCCLNSGTSARPAASPEQHSLQTRPPPPASRRPPSHKTRSLLSCTKLDLPARRRDC